MPARTERDPAPDRSERDPLADRRQNCAELARIGRDDAVAAAKRSFDDG
jgi:hypothetical protein